MSNFLLCPTETFTVLLVLPYVTLCLASALTLTGLWVGSGTHKVILSLMVYALEVPSACNTPSLALLPAGTFPPLRPWGSAPSSERAQGPTCSKLPHYHSPSQNAVHFRCGYHSHRSLTFCICVYSLLAPLSHHQNVNSVKAEAISLFLSISLAHNTCAWDMNE